MDPITSTDGKLRLDFFLTSMRMSHEVYGPRLIHVPSGETLFDLRGTLWDCLDAFFGKKNELTLKLRQYPGDQGWLIVTVYPDERAFAFRQQESPPKEYLLPLAELEHRLDKAL